MNNYNYEFVVNNTTICYLKDNEFSKVIENVKDFISYRKTHEPVALCATLLENKRILFFNEDELNYMSQIQKDFVVGHEIGHACVGNSEVDADEWSLEYLKEAGYNREVIIRELWFFLEIFQDHNIILNHFT